MTFSANWAWRELVAVDEMAPSEDVSGDPFSAGVGLALVGAGAAEKS